MHPFFLTVIGAIFILSLVVILLWIYGREKRYLNALLAVAIISTAWYALIFLLTNSGQIKYYPMLFNKGLPLYYFIGPCFYLYLRGALNPKFAKFKKSHLLHFLITIPAFISVAPYNLLNLAQQQAVVNRVAVDLHYTFSGDKYIVEPWHWFTFPLSGLIYSVLQLRFTYIFSRHRKKVSIIRWAYLFSGLLTIIFIGMLLLNLAILQNANSAYFMLHKSPLILALSLTLLLLSLSFFLNPELIFGISIKPDELSEPRPVVSFQQGVSQAEKRKNKPVDDKLRKQVEQHIVENQAFKQVGLTLSVLASQIDVPNHKLSELFNNYYESNFNTYINNLRIQYIKQRLDMGDWKQFKLEAIALEAGFSSRNTFFVAFKKVMGMSPSTYLSALKNG
ncbi:helix-turn-helix transcriptional regulator [Pedobacter aquatilis]|uniref:helix-turn-helix domain-containing protein n=1 Tax=Pedobacter aquatilis TaxID=351343 RepID=UPI0025B5E883|nr:helix-turn-helix transcriptional regulator [Pedobacter aquatilis]MDN3586241.1 helix-turn-helix transcriptional regulator [Pedobacter aquatilis]